MSKIEEIKHLLEVSRQMIVDKTWPITEDEVVEFISSSFEFGFVCGALWKKRHDQETIELAEDHIIGKVRSILNKVAYRNDGLDVNGDYCEQPYVELDDELRKLLKEE